VLGYIVGLPSLRFRGIYLAISTLAMHYAIVFVATSYQAEIGASASAGVPIPNPAIGPFVLASDRVWYYALLAIVAVVAAFCLNLLRTRPGRAWMAIRDRDIAAVALGVNIAHYKLLAFVVSSVLASVSGALLAYYSNVVTVEKYTIDLAIIYLAMIIVGGMGSIFGAIAGAMFITLLPYGIEYIFEFLPRQWRYGSILFGLQFGAVGLVIILFLVLQPKGLAEVWRRVETYFLRWPFRYRPLGSTRR
jgi:branched-chain amino acid transport system permease protein